MFLVCQKSYTTSICRVTFCMYSTVYIYIYIYIYVYIQLLYTYMYMYVNYTSAPTCDMCSTANIWACINELNLNYSPPSPLQGYSHIYIIYIRDIDMELHDSTKSTESGRYSIVSRKLGHYCSFAKTLQKIFAKKGNCLFSPWEKINFCEK